MSELPRGWAWGTVADICDRADTWDPRRVPNAEFDYIDISSIERQSIVRANRIACADAPSRARQLVRAGDTIVSTVRTYLVNTALVPEELDGATASTGFCVLRPAAAVDARFLFYRVIDGSFVQELSERQTGSSYPAVRDRDVLEQRVGLPPLAEQRRIVAAIEEQLSRLDAANAGLKRSAVRLNALRAAVLDHVTRLEGETLPTQDVADVRGGIQKQPKRRPVANRFPFLRVANVKRGNLDLDDVHQIELFDGELERYRLERGDLLVVEGNGSATQIGRCAMWGGEIPDCVHQNHLIRIRPGERVEPRYLALYWNAPSTARRIAAAASSTSGLYTLSTAKVKAIPVLVPPLPAQRAAVETTHRWLSLVEQLQSAIEAARARTRSLRRAVLASAFRGELVPQDPDDEPASVLLERIAAERASQPKPAALKRPRASMRA